MAAAGTTRDANHSTVSSASNSNSTSSDIDQLRAHRVSLLSLYPSPAPSTRSPSPPPPSASRPQQQQQRQREEDGEDNVFYPRAAPAGLQVEDDAALEPPTLHTYRTSLRHHLLALLPTLALILLLAWISSTYADLSRHRHPSGKPPLVLVPLGAAAWLAAYATRPLVWDITDNALWLLTAPFLFLAQWIRRRRQRRSAQPKWARTVTSSSISSSNHAAAEWELAEDGAVEPSHGPRRTFLTLAVSILFRTVILELLRVGSMAVAIAVLDAATRRGHIWMTTSSEPDVDSPKSESLLLSPYDNRFGAVLWTTVGWCSAEWLIGSYDVLRKLRLYHPSLWPSAMYTDSIYDGDDDHYAEHDGEEDEEDGYADDDDDTIDREAAFPRTRTRASAPAALHQHNSHAGASGIEAATSAAQAAVNAVRFFPRVFTHQSNKSSSSSAFTIRPGPINVGGGGDGNGSAFVLPPSSGAAAQGASGAGGSGFHQLSAGGASGVRRRAATATSPQIPTQTLPQSSRAGQAEAERSSLLPAQSSHHEQFSTALDSTASGMYGTFHTARSFQPLSSNASPAREGMKDTAPAHASGEEEDEEEDEVDDADGDSDETRRLRRHATTTTTSFGQTQYAPPPPLDPEEEDALQARLAHALAILLAARERADLEETLGARLDVQVGPALAALWRIDGFVWNLGECLLLAAAVAITSEVELVRDGDGDGDGKGTGRREEWYATLPDLGASPLLPTWLALTALHTLLSLLWATALPKLGFAPVSYSSLLLGMGLSVAGLAWWGVLI
ncbi:hypothetical protein OC842_006915 [Tilletia horrida]|uniref:Uncharacterized protein n=1 Tax=Tilletia horrida TaxID=155126 RepID=A0AAN6JMY0_9BASI|nr:hypothetical protein OC842_006915 [Tilletia horrida]